MLIMEKSFLWSKIMLKKIIYYVRQFLNLVCISNGLSCLTGVFAYTSNVEMQFIIGGIGVVSFVYGANKIIELYYDYHQQRR